MTKSIPHVGALESSFWMEDVIQTSRALRDRP